ncbi:MAG: amidase family protein, partial [Mycobacterium sp.]
MFEATELVAGYRDKTISPVEATLAALDATEAYNPAVNAFVLVDVEGALVAAEASAARWYAGEPLGPGDGVPTSIKDVFLTRGWPTLRGSALIDAAGPWDEDSPCVARLRETGAVLLGKTTAPEYAWKGVTDSLTFGPTGNPWDPAVTAGGSSGGSAAAVGLGMGPWSVGTDGGGSVRIPAAFTGTVALKPTFGLIPHYPASPFGTLAHSGPMTRTVRDTAALLDVITGFDARDWAAMPTPTNSFLDGLDGGVAGLRVGFSPNLGFVRNDPEVDAAVRAAVAVLAHAGAVVEEVDPGFTDPVEAFHV